MLADIPYIVDSDCYKVLFSGNSAMSTSNKIFVDNRTCLKKKIYIYIYILGHAKMLKTFWIFVDISNWPNIFLFTNFVDFVSALKNQLLP